MKAVKVTLILVALFALCFGAMAQEEQQNPFGANVGVDFNSKYIWRGINLNDNEVIQPYANAWVNAGPVKFLGGVWANLDTQGEHDFTEVDLTAEVSTSIDMFSAALGYIYYRFPSLDIPDGEKDAKTTSEVYAKTGVSIPAGEEVAISVLGEVYWDADDGQGWYYKGGVSTAIPLATEQTVGVTLDPAVSVAFNDQQWGYGSGWADLLMSLGVTTSLGDYITVGPKLNYSYALTESYDDWFWYGINLKAEY